MTMETDTSSEDRLWRAFRYVAGELSADECEAFELEMLNDSHLCEAVVQATTLCLSIADSPAASRSSSNSGVVVLPMRSPVSSGLGRRMVAVAAALCACLLVVGWLSRSESTRMPAETVASGSEDAELLVNVWADEFARDSSGEYEVADPVVVELDVPEWMLTALTEPAGDRSATDGIHQETESGDVF
ncbi:MAG: hypothetical protein R3C49_15770 [Planctomycetaceae bacterium]